MLSESSQQLIPEIDCDSFYKPNRSKQYLRQDSNQKEVLIIFARIFLLFLPLFFAIVNFMDGLYNFIIHLFQLTFFQVKKSMLLSY